MFYAACHVLERPELADLPLVIGGDPNGRGVVSTANYVARRYGIRSAMPASQARRLCPQAVFLSPDGTLYRPRSARVMMILRDEISPILQKVSIDEAFLDATGLEDPVARARRAQGRIHAETGLTASVAVAGTRLCSKVGSDYRKPHGFVVVPPGQEANFLAPLPIEKVWGIGPRTADALHAAGISRVGELAAAGLEHLAGAVGLRRARELQALAHGDDDSAVTTERTAKSYSAEHTFAHDEGDTQRLWSELRAMAEELSGRLLSSGLAGTTVGVKLRYPEWVTVTRDCSLSQPIDDADEIAREAAGLMRRHWQRRPLRLIGLRISGLCPAPLYRQLALFAVRPDR
jgi:DNA polymerase-4